MPARTRDVLLTLAAAGLYTPLWSPHILEEAGNHLPLPDDAKPRLFQAMNTAFPDATITAEGVEFESDVNDKDKHVLATALVGWADVIVTNDRRFYDELHADQRVDAQHCPEFVAYAIDVNANLATHLLVTMAIRRWGAEKHDAIDRLHLWMMKQGWNGAADLLVRNP